MGALETVAPAAGVAGVLALVIGYLLKANASDRAQYQDAVDRAEKRADEMGNRLALAQIAMDEERLSRRQAEDERAAMARQLAALQPPSKGVHES